ncbi:hypothetical protein SSS_01923, partial [Sarcoptes scabiei]
AVQPIDHNSSYTFFFCNLLPFSSILARMAEVERTREFIPNDIVGPTLEERQQSIDERIIELKNKFESFDPKTQFVGIRRLGNRYTIAEPFAFFEAPNEFQLRFERITSQAMAAVIACAAIITHHRSKNFSYIVGLARGLICAGPAYYLGGKCYDFKVQKQRQRNNLFFSYALLHEKDFPVIEKKIRRYNSRF